MNRKGFTLIELLGAIIIMGIILVIVVPNVKDVLNENRNKAYDRQIDGIIESAKVWGSKNISKLPTKNNDTINVTLLELQQSGYAEKDLINPKTEQVFDVNTTYVTITNVNGILNYEVIVEQEW